MTSQYSGDGGATWTDAIVDMDQPQVELFIKVASSEAPSKLKGIVALGVVPI